jgi:hypothetical protein
MMWIIQYIQNSSYKIVPSQTIRVNRTKILIHITSHPHLHGPYIELLLQIRTSHNFYSNFPKSLIRSTIPTIVPYRSPKNPAQTNKCRAPLPHPVSAQPRTPAEMLTMPTYTICRLNITDLATTPNKSVGHSLDPTSLRRFFNPLLYFFPLFSTIGVFGRGRTVMMAFQASALPVGFFCPNNPSCNCGGAEKGMSAMC